MSVWLHVKAGVTPLDPAAHISSWGSGVLSPETRNQLLPLAPYSPCHLTGPLPLPSCVVLGQLLTCFPSAVSEAACPWPPGGSSRRRLAWPPSSPASLASAGSAPPAQPCTAARPAGRGGRGSCGAAHNLLSLVAGAGGRLRAMLCRSSPGGTALGSVVLRLRPSAAASFELPTPLWSLYMPPEETVSTA